MRTRQDLYISKVSLLRQMLHIPNVIILPQLSGDYTATSLSAIKQALRNSNLEIREVLCQFCKLFAELSIPLSPQSILWLCTIASLSWRREGMKSHLFYPVNSFLIIS